MKVKAFQACQGGLKFPSKKTLTCFQGPFYTVLFVIILGWMQSSSLRADKTAFKGSKFHVQAAHVYPKVQALLSFVSYAFTMALIERVWTVGIHFWSRKWDQEEAQQSQCVSVVVAKSTSGFNQRAVVSHDVESRGLHGTNQPQKPTSKCSIGAWLPALHCSRQTSLEQKVQQRRWMLEVLVFTAFTGEHASKPQRQASTIVFTPRAMTLLDLDSRHRCLSAASCFSSSVIGPTGDASSPSCPCWHLAWPRGCPSLVWVISLPKISRGLQGNFAWGFVFWKSAPRKRYLSAAHGPLWEVFF